MSNSTSNSTTAPHRDAVLYFRVSSKDQERGGFSIPAQRKLLHRYAIEQAFAIAAEFTDIETAGRTGRAHFGAMLKFFRQHPAYRVILVEKTDRLYRNLKDWVALDDLGLEIHLVKEGVVLSEHSVSSEKFIHGVKVLMAKNYIDNLSEETRKGLLEKAQQGLWPSHAPLGYQNMLRSDGKRVIEPDPERKHLVAQLFDWYATGNYSMTTLTEKARCAGLIYRKSGKPLPRAQIHALLRNPLYMGEFNWNGARHPGLHEPLVSPEIWERVQAILTGRAPRHRRRQRRAFAFSGLVSCGICADEGKRYFLVGEIKKERYVYYRCEECKRQGRATYVREGEIADAYLAALATLQPSAPVVAVLRSVLDGKENDDRERPAEITRLRAEHDELQARIDLAYEDRLAGRIDATYFDRRTREWRDRIAYLCREITEHEASTTNRDIAVLELAQPAEFFQQIVDATKKRRLLRLLHSNSTWKDGKLYVTWRQPIEIESESINVA